MRLKSVDIVGGGPAGLLTARLLRRRFPDARVLVHEQSELERTFGFGVGFSAGALRSIADTDEEVGAAVRATGHPVESSGFTFPHGQLSVPTKGVVAVERSALLRVLRRLAVEAGVETRYGRPAALSDLNADLVVGADGVSSGIRHELGEHIVTSTTEESGRYLWCGTDFALDRATFESVTTEHGTFTLHAYPYAPDKSTFLIETDEQTCRRAGMNLTRAHAGDLPDSDHASLAYLSRAFAAALHGHRLIGNRTRWSQFRTVSCRQWSYGNVVLIGDAAHTAHYSIGSGTKMAMEDAIALVDALARQQNLDQALQAYDAARRPAVEALQRAAARSLAWWGSFPQRLDLPKPTLLVSYMTRTGRVDLERLRRTAPAVVRGAVVAYAGRVPPQNGDLNDWILRQPLSRGRVSVARRVVEGADLSDYRVTYVRLTAQAAPAPELDGVLTELAQHGDQLEVVWITGKAKSDAADDVIELAERIKRAFPGTVVVAQSAGLSRSALAAALVADRVDLVAASSLSR